MKQTIKLTALLLLINANVLFAHQKKSDSLTFSGTLTDISHAKNDWFMYVGYNISDNFDAAGSTFTFNPKVDSYGNFHFKLPNLGKPYQFTIAAFKRTSDGLEKKKVYSESYFTEPGDRINMDIVIEVNYNMRTIGRSIKFAGIGSEKYKLVADLQNSFDNEYLLNMQASGIYWPGLGLQTPVDSVAINNRMDGMASILLSFQTKKSNMITSAKISPLIRSIINYEYGANNIGFNSEWTTLSKLIYDNHPNFREQIGRFYLSGRKSFIKEPDESVIKYCAGYVDERIAGDLFEQVIKTKSKGVKFEVFYNQIKSSYSGVLRERILARMLTHKRTKNKFMPIEKYIMDSLLNDGLGLAKIPYVKKEIEDILIETRNLGEKIINTEFTKLDGTKIELKTLAGKVILLDVWFNGCFGCAAFYKGFEEIYPEFKDNKNFVVLSVNVDKDRNRWVKGIESKLYTSKEDYIQVSTTNWYEHPFMKHYKIRGASYSMLIDADGKILLSRPSTFEVLAAQIRNALKRLAEAN